MVGKKRRRGALAAFRAANSQNDARLLQLSEKMRAAEHALQAAMDGLARAERRLSEEPRKGGRRPAWYTAAVRHEREAGDILEDVHKRVASVRARTAAGLAIKVGLLATLYGQALGQGPDESDMVSVLIDSLVKDVAG